MPTPSIVSSEWNAFDDAEPRTGKHILIKLYDGRELKGYKLHVELHFDDITNGKLKENHWDTQLKATHWKYI